MSLLSTVVAKHTRVLILIPTGDFYPGLAHIERESQSHSMCWNIGVWIEIRLIPRPLPRKVERGSGVLSNISCHMGHVKNVIIAFPVHMHCTAGILDLAIVLDDIIAYNYTFCNLIWALRSESCDKKSLGITEHETNGGQMSNLLWLASSGKKECEHSKTVCKLL